MNRTDRLHAIDEALRRAGSRGVTARGLADRLEVSVRTIKRDVSALQQTGALIWARPGPGGGYVLDGSASLPPVAFTPSQAVAMSVALAMLPPGTPFAVDARAAAGKVFDTLDVAAQGRATRLAGRMWVMTARDHTPATPTVLRAIERSLAEHRAVAIVYRAADGTRTRRTIEPVMAAWADERWYVVAHCRMRDAIRWFRTDRIARADVTNETYVARPIGEIGTPPASAAPVGS
jgi:predicted DNA-binding transcriptional regulator YafY